MIPAIEARSLSKRYGNAVVIESVSLDVAAGEMVALVGPSGAGKSTLFRCLTRLAEPDRGEVFIHGRPLHGLSGRRLAKARREIGIVFQQYNLVRRLSALENVLAGRLAATPMWRVVLRRFDRSDCIRAAAALERVGLSAQLDQRTDTLSGGQQQRVAIARTLAQECRVLLADEPVASLDPDTAIMVLSLLKDLAREHGLAVLCALHQPELAERFADRILELRAGRIVPRGSEVIPQGLGLVRPESARGRRSRSCTESFSNSEQAVE